MKINTIGSGKKKVLVIHGWYHSGKRYKKLANDLSKIATVSLVTLPGFGYTKCEYDDNLILNFTNEVSDFLENSEFDLIIGHSLGANITIRALEKNENIKSKILLLNPAYYGINLFKRMYYFKHFYFLLFQSAKILNKKTSSFIAKIFALISIRYYHMVDNQVVDDIIAADPIIAYKLLKELAYDNYRVKKPLNNNIVIAISEYDRIIETTKIDILCTDLKKEKVIVFKEIGHTPIVEDYYGLLSLIKRLLK